MSNLRPGLNEPGLDSTLDQDNTMQEKHFACTGPGQLRIKSRAMLL